MIKVRSEPASRPVVSVILTVPKGIDTIQPTLLSVLSSTLEALELIVMIPELDSSVRSLVRGVARVDPRVRPIHVATDDRADARNAGATSALGDILVFMDAGMFLDPTALARITTCLRTHPAVTVVRGRAHGVPVPDHDLRAAEVIADMLAGDLGDVLAVRQDDWDAMEGFDPTLEPDSDRAWLLRIIAGGGIVRAMTVATWGWGSGSSRRFDQTLSVVADTAAVRASDLLCREAFRAVGEDIALRAACRRHRAWRRQGLARTLLTVGQGNRLRPLTLIVQATLIDATMALTDPIGTLRTGLGALATAVLSRRLGRLIGGAPVGARTWATAS